RKASARARMSAARRRSSTPSSTRCRRSACVTSTCRSRATRCGARSGAPRPCPWGKVGDSTVKLEYSGKEQIPANIETVWAFVTDPQKVGRCLPELLELAVQDATHFDAVVRVGVGPVRGKFKFKVELQPNTEPRP